MSTPASRIGFCRLQLRKSLTLAIAAVLMVATAFLLCGQAAASEAGGAAAKSNTFTGQNVAKAKSRRVTGARKSRNIRTGATIKVKATSVPAY